MAEKDFKAIWQKVEAMGLSGQERLDALQAELDKAENKVTVDWSWTMDQMDRFVQIMEELQVLRRGKGMMYLAFAVMLYTKLEDGKETVDEICEMIACKYDTTREDVIREMGRCQKEIYENMTGVRAMVDPLAKKNLDTYFDGNEAKIQNTQEFVTSIAKAM